MAVTTYTAINGVIVHEDRGGTQRNYRPDTLGNTVALTDATTATDTMTYWPYGEIRTRTGSNATRFLFVGTQGYSKEGGYGLHYVRARYYQASRGRWATVDPLWPLQTQYGYASGRAQTLTDPTGLAATMATASSCSVCPNPGGLKGGCVALLCSLNASKSFIGWLKTLFGFDLDDLVDLFNGIFDLDTIKSLKSIISGLGSDPISSAEDCCKKANGFSGTAYDIRNLSQLIGFLCSKMIGDHPNRGFCARVTITESGCDTCCATLKKFAYGDQDTWYSKCLESCAGVSWGDRDRL